LFRISSICPVAIFLSIKRIPRLFITRWKPRLSTTLYYFYPKLRSNVWYGCRILRTIKFTRTWTKIVSLANTHCRNERNSIGDFTENRLVLHFESRPRYQSSRDRRKYQAFRSSEQFVNGNVPNTFRKLIVNKANALHLVVAPFRRSCVKFSQISKRSRFIFRLIKGDHQCRGSEKVVNYPDKLKRT